MKESGQGPEALLSGHVSSATGEQAADTQGICSVSNTRVGGVGSGGLERWADTQGISSVSNTRVGGSCGVGGMVV